MCRSAGFACLCLCHSNTNTFLDCDVTVISGDVYGNDDRWKVAHVLTRSKKEEWGKNYWALPDETTGEFILNLGCEKSYNAVELVNTINGELRDRGTKRFKVFLR